MRGPAPFTAGLAADAPARSHDDARAALKETGLDSVASTFVTGIEAPREARLTPGADPAETPQGWVAGVRRPPEAGDVHRLTEILHESTKLRPWVLVARGPLTALHGSGLRHAVMYRLAAPIPSPSIHHIARSRLHASPDSSQEAPLP